MNDIIVVGGIPEPVGGVTSFIRRLADEGMVDEIIDIYPSTKKNIPSEFKGNIVLLNGLLSLIWYFWSHILYWKRKLIHFNFSRAHSILIFLALPKLNNKFVLMLHHGELRVSKFKWLYKLALSNIDQIYCLSDQQEIFYKALGIPLTKIIRCSSYIPPSLSVGMIMDETRQDIDSFFNVGNTMVASGYPTKIYNHEWCARFVNENPKYKLALFLYGEGALKSKLEDIGKLSSNIKVFWNYDQNTFNYALSKAFIYLRPTAKDSFGIAVADAFIFGIKVLASDVCERYPGVSIFTPTNYEKFNEELEDVLKGSSKRFQNPTNFRKFSYSPLRDST